MSKNPTDVDRNLNSQDDDDYDDDDDEPLSWRAETAERIRWEMFLRNFGPDGDFDYLGDEPLDAEEEAAFAHREMLRRIVKHYNKDGYLDYESMSYEEKAFAHLFEELFLTIDDYDLFDLDIDHWRYLLKIDLPHFPELISRIDDHLKSSEWREICYFEEAQDNLMKQFCENWEILRENGLKNRAKNPDFEYKPWMDRS